METIFLVLMALSLQVEANEHCSVKLDEAKYSCKEQALKQTVTRLKHVFKVRGGQFASCKKKNQETYYLDDAKLFEEITYKFVDGKCKLVNIDGGQSDGDPLQDAWYCGCEGFVSGR